jgi:hypothetical protein
VNRIFVYDLAPDATSPTEALVLDRANLIRVLRQSLEEAHEHRRRVSGTPSEAAIVRLIRYWDAVLGWVKESGSPELVLMSRSR